MFGPITDIVLSLTILVSAIISLILIIIKGYKNAQTELSSLPIKIKKQSNINVEITKKLEELKELLNADRVQIYDFHNGGHYANGRSALKTTCTYEVVRTGIQPKQQDMQCIPLSVIPRFINTLLNKGELEVRNTEMLKQMMPSTYELKKAQNITSFYDIILVDKINQPIGFLAIQYVTNDYGITTDFDKKEVLRLKFFIEENLEQMKK